MQSVRISEGKKLTWNRSCMFYDDCLNCSVLFPRVNFLSYSKRERERERERERVNLKEMEYLTQQTFVDLQDVFSITIFRFPRCFQDV